MVAGANVYTLPCRLNLILDGFGFMAFFVMQPTKKFTQKFPQEPTWVKSVLSFVGDFASGMVGAPVWMMTGAFSAAPD